MMIIFSQQISNSIWPSLDVTEKISLKLYASFYGEYSFRKNPEPRLVLRAEKIAIKIHAMGNV